MEYTVIIDCSPQIPEQEKHFNKMCVDLDINPEWFDEPVKIFGEWTWTVKPEFYPEYREKRADICKYLKSIYDGYSVRYVSW